MRLTGEQARVIAHDGGPALVLACAGAGKTTTLILRIRELLTASPAARLRPEEILLTTFSKRGALDMELRAARLGVPGGVQYRTSHSVAFEVIRSARFDRYVTVPKKWQVSKIVRKELERAAETAPAELRAAARKLKTPDALKEIERAKAALVWPDLPGEPGEWWTTAGEVFPGYEEWATKRPRSPLAPGIAKVIARAYAALEVAGRAPEAAGFDTPNPRRRSSAPERWVTHDDMLALTARAILRGGPKDEWVSAWRGRYRRVLIDEVQDNNRAQWTLVEHLAQDRQVMAVGDDMQAIFVWRGADPGLMREFLARYPDAALLTLSFNFRCGQRILDAANGILSLAPDRLTDAILQRGRGPEAVGDVSFADHPDLSQEAAGVVDEIEASIRAGVSPDEIAVLYRINAQSGPVEIECIRRGIGYRIAGSSFFSRGEVRAAIGYIACALDEHDEDAFVYCCNAPTRYLGHVFLERNPSLARARAALAVNELGQWRGGVTGIIRVVEAVRGLLAQKDGLKKALGYIFEGAGVREHFREEGTDEDDQTEVDEACAALIACSATLGDARKLIDFSRSFGRTGHEDFEGQRDALPRVTLSTVHKAKGLEWGRVHVIGCSRGLFPLKKAPIIEEVRLFYVALTRAKEWARCTWQGKPSPFLEPAGWVPPAPVMSGRGLAAPVGGVIEEPLFEE